MKRFRHGETVFWFDYSTHKVKSGKIDRLSKYTADSYLLDGYCYSFHNKTLFRSATSLLKHVIKISKEEIKKFQNAMRLEQNLLDDATKLLKEEKQK